VGTYDIVIGRSKHDKEKFGLDGTIFLGKHYVQMGQTVALSNKIFLDLIRSHVVFVAGKRGGGKCGFGDTLVTLEDGSRMELRELYKNKKKVAVLDRNLKISTKKQGEYYKRMVSKALHIKMRSGKEIKLTHEHPLLTVHGWKEAKYLKKGSRIATPRALPLFGNRKMSIMVVKILAYIIAEGTITQNAIGFTNEDEKLVHDLKHAVNLFDPALTLRKRNKMQYAIVNKKPSSSKNSLKKLFSTLRLMGKNSYEKFIPQCIFTSTKKDISLFLRILFSCDGSIHYDVNKKSWRISYSSASRQITDGVVSLLLKFRILSRIRPKLIRLNGKKFYSYEIEIKAAHIPRFIEDIGFFGKKEQATAKAYLATKNIVRNPNTDTIPKELWDEYRPKNWAHVGRAMGYKHPKAMRERIRYAPSRGTLKQIAIVDERDDILTIAESDIYWDEVASVKELRGNFDVYDITVPEVHNFIANDIIVHNSYTLGVIAEGMADLPDHIRNNLSIILMDTMGIYWTMKYPNQKERELVESWGLETKAMDVTIFTPHGYYKKAKKEGIPTDREFSIKPSELLGSDWVTTFGIDAHHPAAVLIERIIHDLREAGEFSVEDIISAVHKSKDADKPTKLSVENYFVRAQNWGLFSSEGTPIAELAKPGQVTVLDLSAYSTQEHGWEIKSLVTGIVSQKLFLERMQARKEEEFRQVDRDVNFLTTQDDLQQQFPLVWLVIDEAHEFLPNQGKTLATDPLVTILREGRQPGISLVLASQQPGKIHTDVMTQADTIISHRITAKLDTDALGLLMQSYLRKGLDELLDNLPHQAGAALILDDTNEKMFQIQVRPRMTWHGGESPSAIKKEKELFEF